jgi:hypothetical protein
MAAEWWWRSLIYFFLAAVMTGDATCMVIVSVEL